MFDSVRTRLTLWYIGVLTLTLIVFSLGVYLLLSRMLYQRLDASLIASMEAAATSLVHEIDEGESPAQAANSTVQDLFIQHQALAIYDVEGQLLSERHARDSAQARLPELSSITADQPFLFSTPASKSLDSQLRTAAMRVRIPPDGPTFLISTSQSVDTVMEELAVLQKVFFIAVPLGLLLAGLGGWLLARKSLAPVVMMSESARRISAESLEDRLPVANPRDELGRLATTFNDLLARLNAAFMQQRQFMADASHELRTPLHVIHTAATVTLDKPRREEKEYRDALNMIDEHAARLTHIVKEMFTLARADAGRYPVEQRDFYLDELVAQTSRAASILATDKDITITLAPTKETPYVGDENLLRQMLLNLLDNAIKYTPSGGYIGLQLTREGDAHHITVTDTGVGIPPEEQPHVFERFYRADKARSRTETNNGTGSGAGLGLSIARWVAEAHGGTIKLERSDQNGTTFVIVLPFR